MDNTDKIEYKVRHSLRAKKMRVTIYRDGSVVATVPMFFDLKILEKFITQKKDWIIDRVQKFLKSPLRYIKNSSKKDFKKYRLETSILIQKRLDYFNKYYYFKYNKISIRNQKTRWGSCSKRGNLNFNYKILFLAPEIRDYIVVHELCHLKEFNHSKNFWALVRKTVPNYIEIRKSLKSR